MTVSPTRAKILAPRLSTYIACCIIVLLVLAAIAGPWISPHDPDQVELTQRLRAPDATFLLGTDHLGRDILSRLIAGTRVSLGSVAITLVVILGLGITIGGISGFIGGRVDQIIMRITDVFLTFPTLVLALFMIGMLGTGLVNVIIAIALSHWAWYARIVRGIVLSQLLVLATLDIGHMMLHVSGLSFLGLGVTPPTAEWGVMISDARQFVWTAPMLIFWPGFALFIAVMAFNILGDALRDRLDPHLRAEHCH
ncbi:ABC transporter permease subunit [Agrobacterium salinitolerans]|uniref:ABC transporter permease subunit n=1 Tax=Agrobacterium salinitolerans TaxID=1183413 RepID=UPI0022BB8D9F|nr:ABC transporter permease subunit [Agrobacterium salinitolerans]